MNCSCKGNKDRKLLSEIKEVRFNGPATIIFWGDNTKTVVKRINEDVDDPVVGFLMAVNKKLLSARAYHALCDKLVDIYEYKENNTTENSFFVEKTYECEFKIDEDCMENGILNILMGK